MCGPLTLTLQAIPLIGASYSKRPALQLGIRVPNLLEKA